MRWTFEIPPALASNNPRHHAEGHARRRYQQTLSEMRLTVLDRMNRMKWRQLTTPAVALLDMHVADRRGCDVDATVKCALDCLKPAYPEQPGALLDDRQVELLVARRIVGVFPPRLELACVSSAELGWLSRVVDAAWEGA